MLMVAEIRGVPAVLLNMRTEPGLIGLTNPTATIQSTPDNYMRKHGGKRTPFIEVASNPTGYGTVIHDGEHHDWDYHYINKIKRLLIIAMHSPPPAPEGYCWVALDTARKLLWADDVITNDLRVCLTLLLQPARRRPANPPAQTCQPRPAPLRRLPFNKDAVDAHGTTIAFFRTTTPTREVYSWVQPLLLPAQPLEIALTLQHQGGARRFAVQRLTQPGLQGQRLWFPAAIHGAASRLIGRLATSAEGGRFWRYRIFISLRERVQPGAIGHDAAETAQWLTEAEVSDLAATPLCTSLELRLAWSLVQGWKPHAC